MGDCERCAALHGRIWALLGGRPGSDADPEVQHLDDAVAVTLQYERDLVEVATERFKAAERELSDHKLAFDREAEELRVAVQAVRDGARAEIERLEERATEAELECSRLVSQRDLQIRQLREQIERSR